MARIAATISTTDAAIWSGGTWVKVIRRNIKIGVKNGISVFPSTTGPAYVPFVTGLFPGTSGVTGLVDRFGPPLATAMIVALGSWIEPTATRGEPLELALRSLVWAGASALLLLRVFRRIELGR